MIPKDSKPALEATNADKGRRPSGGLRLLQESQAVLRGSSEVKIKCNGGAKDEHAKALGQAYEGGEEGP